VAHAQPVSALRIASASSEDLMLLDFSIVRFQRPSAAEAAFWVR
jgi:hypothetical protein